MWRILNFHYFGEFFKSIWHLNYGICIIPWWRYQMETFSALLAICEGNSPVTGEFPTQRPVTRSFDVFCDLRLNRRLSKQSWGWWLETLSRPYWRQCNANHQLHRKKQYILQLIIPIDKILICNWTLLNTYSGKWGYYATDTPRFESLKCFRRGLHITRVV